MWIARNKNNKLKLFEIKPSRYKETWYSNGFSLELHNDKKFTSLTWEDEPVEVELNKVDRHYIQCDICGRAFSYIPNDVTTQQISSDMNDIEYVTCPHCRGKIYL